MNTSPAVSTNVNVALCCNLDHADHGICKDLVYRIIADLGPSILDGNVFVKTITLPDGAPDVDCALYGPIMGDPPVEDEIVTLMSRNGREVKSRMVDAPKRPSRLVTVIGMAKPDGTVLVFTAYGGPAAPREPSDASIETDELRAEAAAFWKDHALARIEETDRVNREREMNDWLHRVEMYYT